MIPCPRCARGLSPASSVCDRCGVPISMEFAFSPTFPKPEFFLAELEHNTQAELEKTHQYSLDELKHLAAKMASLEEEERSREEEKKKESVDEEYLPLDDEKDSSSEEIDTVSYDGSDDETTPCLTVEGLEPENFEDIDESDLDEEEDIDESDLDDEEDIDESDLDDDDSDYHEIDEYDEYDDEDDFDIDDDLEEGLERKTEERKTDSKNEPGEVSFEQEIADSRFYESDDGEFEEDCFSEENDEKIDLEELEGQKENLDDDSYVGLDDGESSSSESTSSSEKPRVRKLGPLDSLAPQILIEKSSSSLSEKEPSSEAKLLSAGQDSKKQTALKEEPQLSSKTEKEEPPLLEKEYGTDVSPKEEGKSSDSSDDLEMERVTEYPDQWEWMVFSDQEKIGEEGYQVMGKVEERSGDNLVFPHTQKDNPSLVQEINESDRALIQKLIEEKKIVEAIRLVRKSNHGLSFPHGKDILQLLAKESHWKLAKKCPTAVDKLSPKMRQEIVLMLKEGKTLEACYLLRKNSQLSLTQSREHIEAFCFEQAIDYYPTEIHRPTTRKLRSQIYKKKKISNIFWQVLLIILLACAGYFFRWGIKSF